MKLRYWLPYLVLIFIVLGTCIPDTNAASSSSILISMVPENPAPYENVDISLNSYANNLDTVLISWSVDGKKVSSGIGKKSFSVKAGAAGSKSTVTAIIALPDGSIEINVSIQPSVMVLLWQ